MNRREFLQSMLGAAAVAAMPAVALAKAELEIAPIADAAAAWTPSDYFFSCWVKCDKMPRVSRFVDAGGGPLITVCPMWQRIGFRLSQELGDALSGNSMNSPAGMDVIQRLLKIVNQDTAEVSHALLERDPHAPTFQALEFANLTTDRDPYGSSAVATIRTNEVLWSESRFQGGLV